MVKTSSGRKKCKFCKRVTPNKSQVCTFCRKEMKKASTSLFWPAKTVFFENGRKRTLTIVNVFNSKYKAERHASSWEQLAGMKTKVMNSSKERNMPKDPFGYKKGQRFGMEIMGPRSRFRTKRGKWAVYVGHWRT